MKTKTVALLTFAFLALAIALFAQSPETAPQTSPPDCCGMMGGQTMEHCMEHCQEMKAKHEKMMADMKAMDEKLNQLVTAMNAAKGNSKIDAMAAVLNELIAQRKAMQQNMMSMPHSMMHPCPMMQEKKE